MIDNDEVEYPLHDVEHEVHPRGANIKYKCSYCHSGELIVKNPAGYRVYILNNKLCLEGPDGIYCSEPLKACPKCGRKF